jgi:hypothetical protein
MKKTVRRAEAPQPVAAANQVLPHATSVLPAIDVFIARYGGRELVAGPEVVDLLLDLRLLAEADELVASRS